MNKTPEFGIGFLINKTALHFRLAALQAFKQDKHDITPEQFAILYILSFNDGMYQRQLSKLTLKDRPNITRLLNILEEKGLLYREADPENKRIFKIYITEKGRNTAKEVHKTLLSIKAQSSIDITEEEQVFFKKIMEKFCKNLEGLFELQI